MRRKNFQAEDGIRDDTGSRGLGDVYKRQLKHRVSTNAVFPEPTGPATPTLNLLLIN